MGIYTGITGKLNVGDIIHIGNAFRKEEYCYYRVTSIEGSKAITGFRTFNRNIYHNKYVYEYGKRDSQYDNTYTISSEDAAKRAGANVL